MPDPIHVTVRRKNLATYARDILYGQRGCGYGDKPRKHAPLKTKQRLVWAFQLAKFTGRRYLTYGEVLDVADCIVAAFGTYAVTGFDQQADDDLLMFFDEWLREESRALGKDTKKHQAAVQKAYAKGKAKMWAREALFQKRCPVCGEDVRESDVCGHGYYGIEFDGKGGFVQS